eukprot:TRINITY_DN1211_c0_g2_i1.p1 TRINITY_DN1211_c0_g2~~TRINITY_DN1211_c0_g2_i1.p1  ORF type:complete len:734 (-),score=46.33 TRINITY_DN1211_c0_g2_i1:2570-4501(-)
MANLPHAFMEYAAMANDGDTECLNDLSKALNGFLQERSIFHHIMNTGKNINELGDYHSCLKEYGRYFVINFQLIKIGICVPQGCKIHDIEKMRKIIVHLINQFSPDMEVKEEDIKIIDVAEENNAKPTKGTYIVVGVICVLLVGSIAAAFIDSKIGKDKWNTRSRKVLESFNILKNSITLFYSENRVDKNLDILNGVKILSMGWIMFGHLLMLLTMVPILNIIELPDFFLKRRSFSLYTSASLAVDVFFCLTGFLGILVGTEQLRHQKNNRFLAVLLIYVHRYIRMLPVYVFAILVPLYILPYLGDGANYYVVKMVKGNCEKDWIYNLLYVNNFLYEHNCIGWTWYIANDFQMYLLVPPLILLHQYKEILAYLAVAFLMCGSIAVQLVTFIYYDLTADLAQSQGGNEFMFRYYQRPYCRINPFLIGIFLAWMYISYKQAQKRAAGSEGEASMRSKTIIERINDAIIGNSIIRYTMYLAGLVITTLCVYTFFDFYKEGTSKSKVEHYIFLLFSRPGFIVGLMLAVYPGCLGKAWVLRSILSHEVFNVLSKVVFAAYMFNMEVIGFYWGIKEDGLYFEVYKMWMCAIDIFILSFVVAILGTLIFEFPIIGLSKEFLRPKRAAIISGKEKPAEVKQLTNCSMNLTQ